MKKIYFGLAFMPIALLGMNTLEKRLQISVLNNNFKDVCNILSKIEYPIFNTPEDEKKFKRTLQSITITNLQNRRKSLTSMKNRLYEFVFGTIAVTTSIGSEAMLLSSNDTDKKITHAITFLNALSIDWGFRSLYNAITNKTNIEAYEKAVAITKVLAENDLIACDSSLEEIIR